MEFDVDVTEIRAFARRVAGAAPIVREEEAAAMHRSVLQLEANAKRNAPYKTGNLRRNITSQVRPAGGTITGIVGANTPYARIVEEGRGPVVAKGRALRFTIRGKVLFRKSVGPATGRHYFAKAFAQTKPDILKEFAQVIPRVGKRLGFG